MQLGPRVCPLAKSRIMNSRWCHARYETLPSVGMGYFPHGIPENHCLWIWDPAIDFVSPSVGAALAGSAQAPIPLDYLVNVSFIWDHRQTSSSSRGVMYQLLNLELQEAENTGSASLISPCICFVSWSEVQEQKEYLAQDTDSHAVRSSTILSQRES